MRIMRFFRFFRYLTWNTLHEIIVRSGRQRLPGLAAEIAYNTTLAMFPAIVMLLTVVGMVGSSQSTLEAISLQLSRYAPEEVLELITRFLRELSPASSQSLFSISFIAAVWVASAAVGSAMNALDYIHRVPLRRRRPFWQNKLIAIGLTFGTILLLVGASVLVFVSDFVIKFVAIQGDQLAQSLGNKSDSMASGVLTFWAKLSTPISLGMVALAFAFIYRFGPSLRRRGTPLLPGAILATIFWALLSGLFRLYVSNFGNYNRIYGAVGTIIILLIWLQLSALAMLIGAQLNVTVGDAMMAQKRQRRSLAYVAHDGQHQTGEDQRPQEQTGNEAEQF